MATVKLSKIGLQAGTDRTVYVTWTWSKTNTASYSVKWFYDTGDGVWFSGGDSSVTVKQSTYNAPSNAKRVKVRVKPVSKTYTDSNKKTQYYWTADWTANVYYTFVEELEVPPTPTVTINGRVLTARVDDLATASGTIQFSIMKNDSEFVKRISASISSYSASCSYTIDASEVNNLYKVRCRLYVKGKYSDFSSYSSNVGSVELKTPTWKEYYGLTSTSVYLDWTGISGADSYTIEYTTEKKYFNSSSEVQSITINAANSVSHAEVTGLESGKKWFFRVKAVNSAGESQWSDIVSLTIGSTPSAPTTWSSTTTAIVGQSVNLYWVHNSTDGSSETKAKIEFTVNGVTTVTDPIWKSTDENEKDKTSYYTLDTSSYTEGTEIIWRVKTAGATAGGDYSEWSIARTITVYARPSLDLSVLDGSSNAIDILTAFPFYISASAWPSTQTPVGYHVTITAQESYETVDEIGRTKYISAGAEVYNQFFDSSSNRISVKMTPSNLDLENNISYLVTCVVAMDSGLTAEDTYTFTVGWTDFTYNPFGHILYDPESITTNIRPYCEDENGNEIEVTGVTYGVYRREFDGSFTEIASGIDSCYVSDPHPSLDYARYRIVVTSMTTGSISYVDLPSYYIGENAIVLQWDEEWSSFDVEPDDPPEQPPWSGSMLKLPYNIDVSEHHTVDTELVNYIGRKFPVIYRGTNLSTNETWNVDIAKTDVDTIYALRRLALWTGNVYVRNPSGSGYWAAIEINFSEKHLETVIPVSVNVTRVEGGM